MKKQESGPTKSFSSSTQSTKSITQQLSSIIYSGNREELEKFLAKHENLPHEVLFKSIFSVCKEKKINQIQKQSLQILFRFCFYFIYSKNIFIHIVVIPLFSI